MKARATVVESGRAQAKEEVVFEVWFYENGRWQADDAHASLAKARSDAKQSGMPYHIVKIELPAI